MLFSFRIKHAVSCSYTISCQLSHFRDNLILKIYICRNINSQIFLKLSIRYFVTFFKFSIILPIFLNCIIRQMCKQIFSVFDAVLTRSCSYRSFCIPIAFHFTILTSDSHVMSNIKFAFLVK